MYWLLKLVIVSENTVGIVHICAVHAMQCTPCTFYNEKCLVHIGYLPLGISQATWGSHFFLSKARGRSTYSGTWELNPAGQGELDYVETDKCMDSTLDSDLNFAQDQYCANLISSDSVTLPVPEQLWDSVREWKTTICASYSSSSTQRVNNNKKWS